LLFLSPGLLPDRGIKLQNFLNELTMAKETYFFSHDFNARNDPKLVAVQQKYGLEGLGAYWCIIENLYEQNGMLEVSKVGALAYQLHGDAKMIKDVVFEFGLFKNDGQFYWSESVNKRLKKRANIADKRRRAAQSRWRLEEQPEEPQESPVPEDSTPDQPSSQQSEEVPGNGKKKGKDIDFKAVVELYQTYCPSYSAIVKLSDARKNKIRIRLEEMQGSLETLKEVFVKMEASKFCRGDNKRGWKATFDWLFANEKNWVKVLEGNYDNKNVKPGSTSNDQQVNDIWKDQ
jgi:hypothetical protein